MKDQAEKRLAEQFKEYEDKKNRIYPYIYDELVLTLSRRDDAAALIMDEKKSLKGCFDFIWSGARKAAVGGCACLDEDAVLKLTFDYYGIKEEEQAAPAVPPSGGVVIDLFSLMD